MKSSNIPRANRYMTKGIIPIRSIADKKRFMQIYALANEMTAPIIIGSKSICSGFKKSFTPWYPPASKIIGTESKKENLAAATFENPSSRPMVIVIPERETPGIKARACARPINTESLILSVETSRPSIPLLL